MKYLNFRLIFILCGVFFIMLSTSWFFGAENMTVNSTKNIAEDALFMGVGTHQMVGLGFLLFAIMNLSVLRLDDESAKKMLLGTGTALIFLVLLMIKNKFTGHPHGFYDDFTFGDMKFGSGPPLPVVIFLAILCLSSFYFSIFKKG